MDLASQPILNVDDYPPGLYARSKLLRQVGFNVLEATTGNQTLKIVAEQKPALVLLDVNLPDMSGFEVCRRIKSNPAMATTILHVSATSIDSQHLVHGLDAGADAYLVEPIDAGVLVATVKAFLRARQAEEALRRSNEDLERFAYMVSHELNEPLRTITMHTQRMAERLEGKFDDASRESFQYVVEGADHMRNFINDLLRYSQATHVGSDVRPLEMDTLVDQVLLTLSAAIQDAGGKITRDELPVVVTDARFEHVLQNLIGNALKYRRKDVPPEIHISAKRAEDVWTFSVRDNGIGIEPAYRKTIFNIFRRLHGRDVPGSGIGLAFAQRIVEKNGGRMWVESEPGVGSTFYFTIQEQQEATAAGT